MTEKEILDKIKELKKQAHAHKLSKEGRDKQIKSIQSERDQFNRLYSQTLNEIQTLEKKIQFMNDGITITDHALVRYMERVLGIDPEVLKEKIKKEVEHIAMQQITNGKFPAIAENGQTYKAVFKNNVITTILD